MNSHRALWADSKCSRAILSPAFAPCRAEVDPTPWLELCRQVSHVVKMLFILMHKILFKDACACDSGGDCECLCSAVAAFAARCSSAGAPASWRTPELCRNDYFFAFCVLQPSPLSVSPLFPPNHPSPEEQPRSAAPAGPTPTACPPARRGAARTRSATRPPSACAATSPAWRGASRTGAGPARWTGRSSPPSPTGPACRRPGAPGGRGGPPRCGPAASPRAGGGSERGSSSNKSDARNG